MGVQMRVVELFAGAGGMGLGLSQAGMDLRLSFDAWHAARRVNAANHRYIAWKGGAFVADAAQYPRLIDRITEQRPDLIAGGPPCQDFSAAGDGIEGDRARLSAYYAQLIAIARPEWFVFENVPRAIHARQYGAAKETFRRAGYGLSENILLASRYGVPQNRERLFLIGRLGEADGFLDEALASAASATPMSMRDAVGDAWGDAAYFYPRHTYKKRIWSTDKPSPTVRSSSRRSFPERYVPVDDDDPFTGKPYEPTLADFALLQGFPPEYDFSGENIDDVMLMIANAVPPPLARAVGKVILDRHHGRSLPASADGFDDWLRKKGYTEPSVRNTRSRLNAGRKLLGGRTFATVSTEIGALEVALDATDVSVKTRSDIRSSMRLHRDYLRHLVEEAAVQAETKEARRLKRTAKKRAAAHEAMKAIRPKLPVGFERVGTGLRKRLVFTGDLSLQEMFERDEGDEAV
ncbi:DNA cytosine methyltransferase [Sinorhizobium meliloti]|uniref:DNA cytosine methyltransferase n=1 Tax=Rhizobium meliloti TaxID=382 RepID=UPI0013E38EF6|nr:DNA cytosine methyltransferase [Sinorhizobium meliloti]